MMVQVTTTTRPRPVCILGLGLIGGSLLRDLAAAGREVFGYHRSPSTARSARKEGFEVDSNLTETLARAEETGALIVLAVPMPAVEGLLDAIAHETSTCGITDVVSVKTPVMDLVYDKGLEDRYVGGHPMAGTAQSGWKASQRGLFRGAAWVITFDHGYHPEARSVDELAEADQATLGEPGRAALSPTGRPEVSSRWLDVWSQVAQLADSVGAETIPARVHVHDAMVARVSHLPHLLAAALAVVGDNGGALAFSLAAGSFRDGTRVAASSPQLVRAMLERNARALVGPVDEAIEILTDARERLSATPPDLEALADAGYRSRVRFDARSGRVQGSVSPVEVSSRPVLRLRPGAPGWIRTLVQAEGLGARIEVY